MSGNTNNLSFSVSVVIPAYNISRYIERSIDSVLAQRRQPKEIIVVNDGSTDDTAEKIGEYGDKIKYIYQDNAGLSAARNAGIKAASSEWIVFLDGDDEWLDGHLQTQIELLKRNPHLNWSTGNYIRCLCDEDRRGNDMPIDKLKDMLDGKEYFDDYLTIYPKGATGNANTMIVKREVLYQAGLFMEGLKRAEDMDMWFRIAYFCPKIGYVKEALTVYHLTRPGCISGEFPLAKLYCDLIERHVKFATDHDRLNEFTPLAVFLLRGWIRGMLFDARANDIRKMLRQFTDILPVWYKVWMFLLTVFPHATAGSCHLISKFVRTFNLRRKVVRPPK